MVEGDESMWLFSRNQIAGQPRLDFPRVSLRSSHYDAPHI